MIRELWGRLMEPVDGQYHDRTFYGVAIVAFTGIMTGSIAVEFSWWYAAPLWVVGFYIGVAVLPDAEFVAVTYREKERVEEKFEEDEL